MHDSFCRPSRGPTSTIRTAVGRQTEGEEYGMEKFRDDEGASVLLLGGGDLSKLSRE